MNAQADTDPETMRISIDTKATVTVGEYSRGGRSRGLNAVEALDHGYVPQRKIDSWRHPGTGYWQVVLIFWHQLQNQRLPLSTAFFSAGKRESGIFGM